VAYARGGGTSVVVKTFLGLETDTLDFRSQDRDRDLDKMNSSALETMVSRSTLAGSILDIGDRALA